CLPGQVAVVGIDAEHAHLAGRAVAVALEDLDRGGFAGAVRAEQGEGLAAADVEVDNTHGLEILISLVEAPHLVDILCGHAPYAPGIRGVSASATRWSVHPPPGGCTGTAHPTSSKRVSASDARSRGFSILWVSPGADASATLEGDRRGI